MKGQSVASIGLDIKLNGARVGKSVLEGFQASHIFAVPCANEEIQFGQDVMDGTLERTRRHDKETPRDNFSNSCGRFDFVTVVKHFGSEITAEKCRLDTTLLHGDIPTGPLGSMLNVPGRSAYLSQMLVQYVAGDDRPVAQSWICGNEGGGENGPETVADMDDFLWVEAEDAVVRHHCQLSKDFELKLCLNDRVCVRLVGLACP